MDHIRTDFVLENVFAYLIRNRYDFDSMSAINQKEQDFWQYMKKILNDFNGSYRLRMKSVCLEIGEVNEKNVETVILGIFNELFQEGFTWSRIIAFFVFVAELAIMCISKELAIVDDIYDYFCNMVKENVETWILDHGGWEGMAHEIVLSEQENSSSGSRSWAKSILYTTVKVIGTLASIANTASNVNWP